MTIAGLVMAVASLFFATAVNSATVEGIDNAIEESDTPAAEQPAAASIGEKVRDGKFEFTITDVEDNAKIQNDIFDDNVDPRGKFVAVTLTAENIGDEAQTFSATDQIGIDSKGREVTADASASDDASKDDVFLEDINPGNSFEYVVVFDVAKDVDLKSIIVHDSMFSDGVKVNL